MRRVIPFKVAEAHEIEEMSAKFSHTDAKDKLEVSDLVVVYNL